MTHADANKGMVILMLSKMLNIPTEQIATIGDMPTDVLMFRQSGVSIAMGNATDEVKAQATYVTKSKRKTVLPTRSNISFLVASRSGPPIRLVTLSGWPARPRSRRRRSHRPVH